MASVILKLRSDGPAVNVVAPLARVPVAGDLISHLGVEYVVSSVVFSTNGGMPLVAAHTGSVPQS